MFVFFRNAQEKEVDKGREQDHQNKIFYALEKQDYAKRRSYQVCSGKVLNKQNSGPNTGENQQYIEK